MAIFADPLGQAIAMQNLPWGFWPWTIHAAAWGLAANFAVCVLGSAVTQSDAGSTRRGAFHALYVRPGAPRVRRSVMTIAWVVTMIWAFMAIGPGAHHRQLPLRRACSGRSVVPRHSLDLGWQLIWWAVGVLLVWFLAYGLRLSADGALPSASARSPLSSSRDSRA